MHNAILNAQTKSAVHNYKTLTRAVMLYIDISLYRNTVILLQIQCIEGVNKNLSESISCPFPMNILEQYTVLMMVMTSFVHVLQYIRCNNHYQSYSDVYGYFHVDSQLG